jgi:hypothetical protein
VAAFCVWAYLGRNLWFFGDEWDFLTRRGLHGASFSIWAPHNEHWSVLPILLWRAIFSLAHLSSYWPYLVPLLLVHVAVVHLLWRRLLRDGAVPWVATLLAGLFALLGSAAEDLTWAFQVGFLGSLLLGLLAMELADSPRALVVAGARPAAAGLFAPAPEPVAGTPAAASPRGRALARDAAVSALVLAALMCSTVGVAMAVAVAVMLVAGPGWRRALRTLAVPACAYVVWFALSGHKGLEATGDYFSASVFFKVPEFVATNLTGDVGRAVGSARLGPVLAVGLLAWLIWSCRRPVALRPAALGGALAAVTFYTLAALARDRISPTMSPSRYVYIGVALLLPSVGLILSAFWRGMPALRARSARWRRLLAGEARRGAPKTVPDGAGAVGGQGDTRLSRLLANGVRPVVIAVVALAMASNVAAGVRFARSRTVYVRRLEHQILTTAQLLREPGQLGRAVDGYPIWASGFASGYLTPALLVRLAREGVLPRPQAYLMTRAQLVSDETWLDVATGPHPLFAGRFRLLGGIDVTWYTGLSGRHFGHAVLAAATIDRAATRGSEPPGPGGCAATSPRPVGARRHLPPTLRLGLVPGARSGAFWLSFGRSGGEVFVSLAQRWGPRTVPPNTTMQHRGLKVPAGRYIWVSDSSPGDTLLVQVPERPSAELCGLRGIS